MNATATTSRPSRPTAAERFEEVAPVLAYRRVAGPSVLLLVGPWLLLVLLLIPPAAVLITLFLVVALPVLALALVGAVVASPFLLARAVIRRNAERRQSSERVRRAMRPARPPGVPAVAPSTNRAR